MTAASRALTTLFFDELDSGMAAEYVLPVVMCVDAAVTEGLLGAGVYLIIVGCLV